MKRVLTFENDAFDEYTEWASSNKKIFNKIAGLIKEIQRTPYEGTGKPEQLKHEKSGQWSRRINDEDRLVYEATDDKIIIYSCKGHYD